MGRVDLDPLSRRRVDPPAISISAGKNQRVHVIALDHCEPEIAIARDIAQADDEVPHGSPFRTRGRREIDLEQVGIAR